MTSSKVRMSRRRWLGASLAVGSLVATRNSLALAAIRTATPPQTLGPFYPVTKPLDQDNDLTVISGRRGRAQGTPIHVIGRVVDRTGRPIGNAVVEIWQANALGRYHHPRDPANAPIDPNFQGYGHNTTGDDGAYRFFTIQPPPYPASADWMRPAHIHFAIKGPGFERLVTQMYFTGDPYLDDDRILNAIADPAARASVIITLQPPPAGLDPAAQVATFDIVLATNA